MTEQLREKIANIVEQIAGCELVPEYKYKYTDQILSLPEIKEALEKDKHPDNARIYPCVDCGKLRSKDEGGTTFTVCDECWEKHYEKIRPEVAMPSCPECGGGGIITFTEQLNNTPMTTKHTCGICKVCNGTGKVKEK